MRTKAGTGAGDEVLVIIDDPAGPLAAADAAIPVLDDEPDDKRAKLPATAIRNDDGTVTLPLAFPRTLKFRSSSTGAIREEEFAELVMHRLTGADLIATSSASEGSRGWVAIARSARIAEGKMKLLFPILDASDANAAGQVVAFFLEPGRPTGP